MGRISLSLLLSALNYERRRIRCPRALFANVTITSLRDESTLVLIKTMRRRFIILICVSWWKKSSGGFSDDGLFFPIAFAWKTTNSALSVINCEVACDRCWRRKFSIKTRHFGVRNRSINQTFLAHNSECRGVGNSSRNWPAFFSACFKIFSDVLRYQSNAWSKLTKSTDI